MEESAKLFCGAFLICGAWFGLVGSVQQANAGKR